MTKLEKALHHAAKGWPVFPCNGKLPYTEHGHLDATTDPEQVKRWWKQYPNANVGFALPESIVVLDVDIKHHEGKYGDEALEEYEREHGKLPPTVEAITQSGGRHLYFKTDKPVPCRNGFLPSLDCKSKGGYVILYEWEASSDPADVEMAMLPDSLYRLITAEQRKEAKELPKQIPQGQRNEMLFKLACSLRAKGLTEAGIQAAVWQENIARCNPPLTEREIRTLSGSSAKYPAGGLLEAASENWPHLDHKERPIKHWENTRWICQQNGIVFRYNELIKDTETDHPEYKELSYDSVITELRGLCALRGYSLTKQDTSDHILRMAEENQFNPVRDYLNECMEAWDGKSRTRDLFNMLDNVKYSFSELRHGY